MKIVKKFQDGGMVPADAGVAPETAPMDEGMAPQGGEQDPMAMIVQLFVDGLQTQNCEELAQGAEMFLQLIQQAQGGAPEGQPVFAKGGKIVGVKRNPIQLVRK